MEIFEATGCLGALAHEGRLGLVRRLVQAGPEGMRAGDLARAAGLRLTTASAQLAILSHAGLIQASRQGREIHYRPDYARLGALVGFLMRDCCRAEHEPRRGGSGSCC